MTEDGDLTVTNDTTDHENAPSFGTAPGTTLKHPLPSAVPVNSARVLAPNSASDVELYYLARLVFTIVYLYLSLSLSIYISILYRYLKNVSLVDDVSVLDHSRWRLYSHHILPDSRSFAPSVPNGDANCEASVMGSGGGGDANDKSSMLSNHFASDVGTSTRSDPIVIGSSSTASNPGSASASAAGTPSTGNFLPVLSSSPSVSTNQQAGYGNDVGSLLVRSRSNSIQMKDGNLGGASGLKEGGSSNAGGIMNSPGKPTRPVVGAMLGMGLSKEDADIPSTGKDVDPSNITLSSMSYSGSTSTTTTTTTSSSSSSPIKPNKNDMINNKRSDSNREM